MKISKIATNATLLLLSLLLMLLPNMSAIAAQALAEGIVYDEAHDDGYIDWTGDVSYLTTVVGSGDYVDVTYIAATSSVGGVFQRDVVSFKIWLKDEYRIDGVGEARVSTCGTITNITTLDKDGPSGTYSNWSFRSFSIDVPVGCRNWTISALGGHVLFSQLETQYIPASPTPTLTATFTPTVTLTPTQTLTPSQTLTPTLTPSPTLVATLMSTQTPTQTTTVLPTEISGTPWVVTVPVVIVVQNQTVDVASGSSLSDIAVTPTPYTYGNSSGYCHYALRTFVYVDSNDDKIMSPNEGAQNLEIVFMDTAYTRLGVRYTDEGQSVFCLNPALAGQLLHVDIPYLHQSQTVNIPKNLDQDVEVWFRLEPPTLPIYLP